MEADTQPHVSNIRADRARFASSGIGFAQEEDNIARIPTSTPMMVMIGMDKADSSPSSWTIGTGSDAVLLELSSAYSAKLE